MSTALLWFTGAVWVATSLFWFAMGYIRGRFDRWWFRSWREAVQASVSTGKDGDA